MMKAIKAVLLIIVIVVGWFLLTKNNKTDYPKCSFEVLNVQKFSGFYGDNSDGRATAYIVQEGLIRNNSNRKEFLKEMIMKAYTKEGVFLGEAYDEINKDIDPGKSITFKLKINVDRYDNVLRKYFDEAKEFKIDIYPWFTSCY